MKSGLLEIADVLVVNKGDRPGAEQTLQQLMGALSIRASTRAKPPVLKTTATSGEGVAELVATVDRIGREIALRGAIERRRRRARYLIARAAADIVAERVREGEAHGLETLADEVLTGALTPDAAARRLLA
jgi:LAO/AO transport system kinase